MIKVNETPQGGFKCELIEVWNALAIADKYDLDLKATNAKAWFAKWYEINYPQHTTDFKECQILLFPCYAFEHAEAFLHTSKCLVYNGKAHILDRQPHRFFARQLHAPQRVIRKC